MKTRTVFVAAVLCASALYSSNTFAADVEPTVKYVSIGLPGKTEIDLTQQAVQVMARDRISAQLRIESKGNSGKEIQADINKKMATALDKVKQYPAVNVQTGSYSVSQNYNTKTSDLWEASQNLTITSDDFDAVLALVGDLQNNGLLMSDMNFFLAPETLVATQKQLTADALISLRERANDIAQDLHMGIDSYKVIRVGNAIEDSAPASATSNAAAAAKSGKTPPPAARAGSSMVTLTVVAQIILATPKAQ